MKIELNEMLMRLAAANGASEYQIKDLNESEKKLLKVILKAIEEGSLSVDIERPKIYRSLSHTLEKPLIFHYPSPQNKKIVKSIANFLHWRTSSSEIIEKIELANSARKRFLKTLQLIDDQIIRLKKSQKELKTLREFKQNFLIPFCQNMADFFLGLPKNQEKAKLFIQQKISEVEAKIRKLSVINDDALLLKINILANEVLKSLKNLEKYDSTNWNSELAATEEAWKKAANRADDEALEVLLLKKNSRKIQELKIKKKKLEELIIPPTDPNMPYVQKVAEGFASRALAKEKSVVLACVKEDGLKLQFVEGDLRNDWEIARAALTQNQRAFSFVGKELKKDSRLIGFEEDVASTET